MSLIKLGHSAAVGYVRLERDEGAKKKRVGNVNLPTTIINQLRVLVRREACLAFLHTINKDSYFGILYL